MKTIQRLRPVLVVGLTFATLFMVFFNLSKTETPLIIQAMSVLLGALIIMGLFGLSYLEEVWRKQAEDLRAISQENIRLYTQQTQRAEQLSMLQRVTALLTETLAPNEVLDSIVTSASMIAGATAVTVYIYNAEKDTYTLSRQVGFIGDWETIAPKPLLASEVSKTTPVIVNNTLTDSRTSKWLNGLALEGKRSFIELPMMHAKQLDGVLGLFFNQPRTFSTDYMDVVQAFVTQIAQALYNAHTYESTDKALGITTENLRSILDARETYTQMVVHDLRSPLTAVTTSLTLLNELIPKDSEHIALIQRTTDLSKRAIRKVLARVDSMLDIAKMESGTIMLDREPTSLKTLADNVRNELSPIAIESDIQIALDFPNELPLLFVDSDKIERMILNLTDNALKYTPYESTVEIRAKAESDQFVRLEVSDRGQGIPDEYKQSLFDRFTQIEGRQVIRRGVGLGLSFCKMVVEAHHGKIWIEDNPQGGTIFCATLPIMQLETLEKKDDTPSIAI